MRLSEKVDEFPAGKEREYGGAKKILEEIPTKNIPKQIKVIKPQLQEALQTSRRINKKKPHLVHHSKIAKGKILKAPEGGKIHSKEGI